MTTHYLACDLGAESGRVMLGTLDRNSLALEEVVRFPNTPMERGGHLFWDIDGLFAGILSGLKLAGEKGLPIAGVSADSWGVDYLLLDGSQAVLAPTFHYRDPRSTEGVRRVHERVDAATLFAQTGIQFMPINTVFQLAAESPERLANARHLLNIGDGFNFLLSGVVRAEQSLASTSQLFDPRTGTWAAGLLQQLALPRELFPPIVPSGTRLGPLKPAIAAETGLQGVEVIATCSHDTGAAVAAVPAAGNDWAYLSSGTWSLMGVERGEPVLTDTARELNFTNEIGHGGTIRLLKNIIGLWLVQECKREWSRAGQEFEYAELTRLAEESPAFVSLINPADPRFMSPGDMPAKITAYCAETKQPVPATPGACVRCILESLALFYRHTLRQLERLIGNRIARLHVVGGGSRNALLNQFIANALNLPVYAGPAEASATGNVLLQAIALGHLPSLAAARDLVGQSVTVQVFEPQRGKTWENAFRRFQSKIRAL